jgi:hypothetical protein
MDDELTDDAYWDFPKETAVVDDSHTAYEEICKAVTDICIKHGIDLKLGDKAGEAGLTDIMIEVDSALHEAIYYDALLPIYNAGHSRSEFGASPSNSDTIIRSEHKRLMKEISDARMYSWKSPVEILKESFKPAGAK